MNTKIHKIIDHGPISEHIWEFELELPEYLAKWDVWDYWERERFKSMQTYLNKDSILYDIGTEQGACSALIAKYFTPNVVLIEPSREFWPTIQYIWDINHLPKPLGFWAGFASNKDFNIDQNNLHDWSINGSVLKGGMPYRYIHNEQDKKQIPSIKIDTLVSKVGLKPDAINIDVEGAELLVLKGCSKTLKRDRPLVWTSIHPDLALRDYKTTKKMVMEFFATHNYDSKLLSIDHEEHWLFIPSEKKL